MWEFKAAWFWGKVQRSPEGCWVWCGDRNTKGYGRIPVNRGARKGFVMAHRVLWERLIGPIPEGLQLDHLCRNRACVHPKHLEPVTRRENILRGESFSAQNARKTHCAHGHEFTPENTRVKQDGSRHCRICTRASHKRYRQRRLP